MRRRMELVRRRLAVLPRWAALAMVFVLVVSGILMVALSHRIVTVVDDDGTRVTLLATTEEPETLLQLAGVAASENDEIVYSEENGQPMVTIRRAFPAVLVADGETHSVEVVEGTVADLLSATGVQLDADDYTEPGLSAALAKDQLVLVHRVDYVEEVRREELSPEAVAEYRARLPEGTDFVESYNGAYDVTYRDRMVDGKYESSEIVQVVPLIAPRPADSYELIPGVPCSRIEGYDDVQMGPDGRPQSYTRLWPGAVCTAYSSSGGRGASGLGLYCGTVAVNPNIIPYGTRMFITSADGNFIYGFAIATDTGTAMMEGYVDIDLYFETNAECLKFGKRLLDVYILD